MQADFRTDYRTESPRAGLLIGLPLLVMALFVSPFARLALLALAVGPLLWAVLQSLRRGRGVRLYGEYVAVQRSISGRVIRIPYTHLLGHAATRRGGLALVYRESLAPPEPVPAAGPSTEPVTSFNDIRVEDATSSKPRRRFILTAKLDRVAVLADLIAARRDLSAPDCIPSPIVQIMARRRRLRDALIVLLLLLSLPLWVIVIV